jgi:hypothetical protein
MALVRIARFIVGAPGRMDEPPPPSAGQEAGLNNLPPFTGTAEEAQVLWNSPPIALVRQKRITPIQQDGSILDVAEYQRLTAIGKILAREDYLLMDDFGLIRPSSNLAGQCQSCRRFGFEAVKPCSQCKTMHCCDCSVPVPQYGPEVRLCARCARTAQKYRNNWALPSSPLQS